MRRGPGAAGNYLRISGRSNGMTRVTRLFGIVVPRHPPDLIPAENLRRLPRVRAREHGLTKIPNKEVSAMPTGGTSIPQEASDSPRSSPSRR